MNAAHARPEPEPQPLYSYHVRLNAIVMPHPQKPPPASIIVPVQAVRELLKMRCDEVELRRALPVFFEPGVAPPIELAPAGALGSMGADVLDRMRRKR